jgi:putative membrane protein
MVGSLRKIWPWKETLKFMEDRHGQLVPIEQINVLPAAWSTEVTLAIILAIVGIATVLILDYIGSRQERSEQTPAEQAVS